MTAQAFVLIRRNDPPDGGRASLRSIHLPVRSRSSRIFFRSPTIGLDSGVTAHTLFRRSALLGCSLALTLLATPDAWAQSAFAFDSVPLVTIPMSALESPLHAPVGMVRVSEGLIAIVDAHGGTVMIVDAVGRVRNRLGRTGDGPGEFRHVTSLARCGQGDFFAFDQMHSRISMGSSSEITSELQLTRDGDPISPLRLACSADRRIAVLLRPRRMISANGDSPVVRGLGEVLLVDSSGVAFQKVADVPTGEFVVLGGGAAPRPLGLTTHIGIGRRVIAIMTGDSAFIELFNLQSGKRNAVRLPLEFRVTSQADYEASIEEVLEQVPARIGPMLRAGLLLIPRPKYAPLVDALHIDDCDRVWLSSRDSAGESTLLTVISSGGDIVANGRIRQPLRVMDTNTDYVLGLVNSDGEEQIALFAVPIDSAACT